MEKFAGMGICPGQVIGPVYQMAPAVEAPDEGETWDRSGTSVEAELARLTNAAQAVQAELHLRAGTAEGDAKALLETTALMAADPMLLQSANAEIIAGVSAERSIWEAGSQVGEMLKGLGGYMAQRMPNVLDVRSRIVAELRGQLAATIPHPGVPFILAATYLAPADASTLDPAIVIGIVTTSNEPQSESFVLAKNLGIPTVVGARGAEALDDGTEIYLDGISGEIIRDPSEAERAAASLWAGRGGGPVTRSL